MPSSSSGLSGEQRFDLQTKENSQELHEKLTSILERFEQTRQAIRENVKMLGTVSDSTAALDSPVRTEDNTIDSHSSYPSYSSNKRGRSMSSTRLSSMDMTSGTGNSCGLRTISSVDSGVMLTLTSCSENGTQSRRRSLGSWHGTTSPMFFTNETDCEEKRFERQSSEENILEEQDLSEPGEDSYSDREADINAGLSSSQCFTGDEEVFNSPRKMRSDCVDEDLSESSNHSYQVLHSSHKNCACPNHSEEEEEYDKDRFETQENFIVLESESEDDVYQVRSPHSNQSGMFSVGSESPTTPSHNTSQSQGANDSNVRYRKNSSTSRKSSRCIVLPPAERNGKSQRPSTLNITSHLEFQDEWMERDHITIPNPQFVLVDRCPGPQQIPKATNHSTSTDNRFNSADGHSISADNHSDSADNSDSADSHSDSADECCCNASGQFSRPHEAERRLSSGPRLIFSPIPEESPSELTPSTPVKGRRLSQTIIKLSSAGAPAIGRSVPAFPSGLPHRNLLETSAQVHHSSLPQRPAHFTSSLQNDEQNTKPKKYRHKRKKASFQQTGFVAHCAVHSPPNSTTSSSISSIDNSTPRSDAISMSSYRNAIDRHAIPLPQISTDRVTYKSGVNTETLSSLSSPSYYESRHSSSSGSSSSDTEYDFQVSLQASRGIKNSVTHHQQPAQTLNQLAEKPTRKKIKPPVIRKIGRESGPKVSLRTPTQESPKTRLFAKNSPKIGGSKHKLAKGTSDQPSYSLLRYFRFPSPPRTTGEDNSDSSARGKDEDKIANQKTEDNSGKIHVSRLTQTMDLEADDGRRGALASSDSFRSCCSCATSSTTDTASEIAYPDLKPRRTTQAKLSMENQSQSKLRNQSLQQQHRQHLLHQPSLEQYNLLDQMPLRDSPPLQISYQPLDVRNQPTASGIPSDNIHPQYLNTHNFAGSPQSTRYSIQAKESAAKDKKKPRCSLFSRLFRRQKCNKRLLKHDPKLMLDLAGGEVRINPQEHVLPAALLPPAALPSMSSAQPLPPGVSYYMVPVHDSSYPPAAYRAYPQEFQTAAAAAATYESHLQAQSASHRQGERVYLRPRMEDQLPNTRHKYTVSGGDIISHRPRNTVNAYPYELDESRLPHPLYPYHVIEGGYSDYNHGYIPTYAAGRGPTNQRLVQQVSSPRRTIRSSAEAAAYFQHVNAQKGYNTSRPSLQPQPQAYMPNFTRRPRKVYHIL